MGPIDNDSFRISNWDAKSHNYLDDNSWHFVTIVYKNHLDYGWTYAVYMDGKQIQTNWHDGWKNSYGDRTTVFSPKGNSYIGASAIKGYPSDFFKGYLANMSLYDIPITQKQIKTLYEKHANNQQKSL